MPILGGEDATKEIRRIPPSPQFQQPRISALTANAFPEDKQKYLAVGMDHVLTKPINRTELAEWLDRIASEKRRKQDLIPPVETEEREKKKKEE